MAALTPDEIRGILEILQAGDLIRRRDLLLRALPVVAFNYLPREQAPLDQLRSDLMALSNRPDASRAGSYLHLLLETARDIVAGEGRVAPTTLDALLADRWPRDATPPPAPTPPPASSTVEDAKETALRALATLLRRSPHGYIEGSLVQELLSRVGVDYKRLGFKRLKAFLTSLPGLHIVTTSGTRMCVALADAPIDERAQATAGASPLAPARDESATPTPDAEQPAPPEPDRATAPEPPLRSSHPRLWNEWVERYTPPLSESGVRAEVDRLTVARDYVTASQVLLAFIATRRDTDTDDDCWLYTRLLAAAAGGSGYLESTAPELRQRATPQVKTSISAGIGRLAEIDVALAQTALGGQSPLAHDLRDWVIENWLAPRDRGRSSAKDLKWQWLDRLAEATQSLMTSLITHRDRIVSSSPASIGASAKAMLKEIGYHKDMMLPTESAAWQRLRKLLGRSLTETLSHRSETAPSTQTLEALETYNERLQTLDLTSDVVTACVFDRMRLHIIGLVDSIKKNLLEMSRPSIEVTDHARRRPLGVTGRGIDWSFEIENTGRGTAEVAEISLESDDGCTFEPSRLILKGIAPGERRTVRSLFELREPLRRMKVTIRQSATGRFGGHTDNDHVVFVEPQGETPDWNALQRKRPYSLQPIEDSGRLLGRGDQMAQLRLAVSSLSGAIIWGQKRVGKTSVARVLAHQFSALDDWLVLYIRKGDVAGSDEAALGLDIAERLLDESRRRGCIETPIEVPALEAFGARLSRLNRFIDDVRRAGMDLPILLVIDEFDELNPGFYKGERGEHFFSALRSLSERRIAFVLVGSERMQAIFKRYAQQLNKLDTLRLDTIQEPSDLRRLIEHPVDGFITFESRAVNQIAQLSGGNPYYVNLMCTRLVRRMIAHDRTSVDPADVSQVVDELSRDNSPNHWNHLWADGAEDAPPQRDVEARDAALVLAAFGQRPINRALSLYEIRDWLIAESEGVLPSEHDCEETLERLVRRRVVKSDRTSSGMTYRVSYPIFGHWLLHHGRSTLLVPHRAPTESEIPRVQPIPEQRAALFDSVEIELPIVDDDIEAVAERLTYRGRTLSAPHVKAWLQQFRDDAHIVLAYKLLLGVVTKGLIDERAIRAQLDRAFEVGRRHANKLGILPTTVKSDRPVIANFYAGYLGPSDGASARCAKVMRRQRRLSSHGAGKTIARWLARPDGNEAFVIVVDQFVDDDDGLLGRIDEFLDAHGEEPGVRRAIEDGRVLIVPLWAYADASARFDRSSTPIEAVTKLAQEDRAFHHEAGLFDSAAELRIARDVCRHIGGQLMREHPLGARDRQGLIILPDAVPSTTLPVFWAQGVVDEREWRPLVS